jgi:hypothetical protein
MSLIQAAFTSPTPESSVNLPPHLKGVQEISVESHEKASPIVSQSFKKRRYVKTNPSPFPRFFCRFYDLCS